MRNSNITINLKKKPFRILILILILFSVSCGDENPLKIELSISNKINEARPYKTIQIDFNTGAGGPGGIYNNEDDFFDAYASGENLLIKKLDGSIEYYNLLTVKSVHINKRYNALLLEY